MKRALYNLSHNSTKSILWEPVERTKNALVEENKSWVGENDRTWTVILWGKQKGLDTRSSPEHETWTGQMCQRSMRKSIRSPLSLCWAPSHRAWEATSILMQRIPHETDSLVRWAISSPTQKFCDLIFNAIFSSFPRLQKTKVLEFKSAVQPRNGECRWWTLKNFHSAKNNYTPGR